MDSVPPIYLTWQSIVDLARLPLNDEDKTRLSTVRALEAPPSQYLSSHHREVVG